MRAVGDPELFLRFIELDGSTEGKRPEPIEWFREELSRRGIPTGETRRINVPSAPLGDRVYDDLYPELEPDATFALEATGRRLEARFGPGYPVAQVYAPEGQEFICFEPMTAPTNALVTGGTSLPLVAPGEAFTARFAIAVLAG